MRHFQWSAGLPSTPPTCTSPPPRACCFVDWCFGHDKLAAYVHRALNVEPVTYMRRQYEGLLLPAPAGARTFS